MTYSCSFRGCDFWQSAQSQNRVAANAHLCFGLGGYACGRIMPPYATTTTLSCRGIDKATPREILSAFVWGSDGKTTSATSTWEIYVGSDLSPHSEGSSKCILVCGGKRSCSTIRPEPGTFLGITKCFCEVSAASRFLCM